MTTPNAELRRIIRGFEKSQLIYVAVKLGLADLVPEGGADVETLARATGVAGPVLFRVLRGMAWCGLLDHGEGDRFTLTPLGRCLRADAEDSLRDHVLCIGEIEMPAWSALLRAIRTGENAFAHVFGTRFYDYLGMYPEAGAYFDRLMGKSTTPVARAVARAYDFSAMTTVVDLGAGNGTLMTAILSANPGLRGIVFDLPPVIARAAAALEGSEVAPRISLVGGDFFAEVPAGADGYMLRWVLHNWDDEDCVRLLASCRRAIAPAGRLLVIEELMPERVDRSSDTVSLDLGMLVHLDARERTEREYRALLARGGFRVTRVLPTDAGVHVVESKLE